MDEARAKLAEDLAFLPDAKVLSCVQLPSHLQEALDEVEEEMEDLEDVTYEEVEATEKESLN